MCNPFIHFIWINILYHVSCNNQLVRPGFTRANSSSVAFNGYPSKTVDGNNRQNHYTFCMFTAAGHREAWLRIDLRKIYNIHSVKFWYINDSRLPGYDTRRIQGFSIRLSNKTQTDRQDICYQDDGKTTLPPIIEQQCKGVAQFVWIYTNKTFSDVAFLGICEVQVYGCSYQDSDGNCIPCDQCKNDCNIHGECDGMGCKSEHFLPPFCKACRKGFYGRNCSRLCGHCAENLGCDQVNGSCSAGRCESGWSYALGDKCNKVCNKGFYGKGCLEKCGHCDNDQCHHINGSCSGLCKSGYQGYKCDRTCNPDWYGRECKEKCGYCRHESPCHPVTGSCSGLCEPGYSGDKCAFSEQLANQREMIKLMRDLLSYKRRKVELKENGTSPTDLK
ncbi:multiple epidermal growth factor-like domains protein 6 isoform X2 [Saccostrea cucullata]|uniref:multiple epidermal growth factor-like domains protein 6 isoform X2 n=1 Tax=Saccostrea cuccullata TaxID=36930 RepID=UPI002ED2E74B